MKALYYSDWGRLEIADLPRPEPGQGEVLIRVEACGICGSEVECVEQRHPRRQPPLVLGHECCGVVEALGPGARRFREGDAVVANSVIACGACFPCRRGDTHLCRDRRLFGMHRPGACAEYVAAPESVLCPRPAGMSAVVGALAEPASNGVHSMGLLPHIRKESVFIFGAGIIGLGVLQAARVLHGARVAVADLADGRLDLAKRLGAERVFNPARDNVMREAMAFTGADGFDYVIDAVGAAVTKRQSIELARPGGGICWLGLRDDEMPLATFAITLPQKVVTGSYSATEEEYRNTVQLLGEGRLRLGEAARAFPMSQAVEAFRQMANPAAGTIKSVVLPQE